MKFCDDCKYADWRVTKAGRLHPSKEGKCLYVVKVPVLPTAFYFLGGHSMPFVSGGYIERRKEYNNHCPCYQEKGKKA